MKNPRILTIFVLALLCFQFTQAQNIWSYSPSVEGATTSMEQIRYSANLVPVLTKAIQEQQAIIDNQNKRLSELELLVKKLEATK